MKRLLPLMFILSAVSCGKSGHKPQLVVIPHFEENAVFLDKEVTDCAEKSFDDSGFEFDLNLFLVGNIKSESRDFKGLVDGLYVRDVEGQSIKRSLYGGRQFLLADIDDDGNILGIREDRNRRVEPHADVSVCPDKRIYDTNSIEGATLNSSYFINEVHQKVRKAAPQILIKPIDLNIGTIVEVSAYKQLKNGLHKLTMYVTDNAYYSPDTLSIDFLPQSKNEKNAGQPNLWNVPMVPAHEYGHHIFNMITPQEGNSTVGGCFGENSKLRMRNGEILGVDISSGVTNESVENALNEGFADLIAYYSLRPDEYSLNGINHLAYNREVGFSYFIIYGKKEFSDSILNSFFSAGRRSDDYTNFFQDGHILGAIFAHRADQFMNSLGLSRDARLETILRWAQDYANARASMRSLTPRGYLDRMLQLFIRANYQKPLRTIDSVQCKEILDFYPYFAKTFPECSGDRN
jgi:hypothetical protein